MLDLQTPSGIRVNNVTGTKLKSLSTNLIKHDVPHPEDKGVYLNQRKAICKTKTNLTDTIPIANLQQFKYKSCGKDRCSLWSPVTGGHGQDNYVLLSAAQCTIGHVFGDDSSLVTSVLLLFWR